MKEEQTNQANYQKGFNEGYLIAEHMPELSDQISKIDNDVPRIEGLRDGGKQFVLDRSKEFRPSWMKPDRVNEPQNSPSKTKDKEPER